VPLWFPRDKDSLPTDSVQFCAHRNAQPPGIARVDGRAKEGRLLKRIRKGILDRLSAQGGEPSIVHHSLTERAAWLEFNISYVPRVADAGPLQAARVVA
jgi:hypothetical protein